MVWSLEEVGSGDGWGCRVECYVVFDICEIMCGGCYVVGCYLGWSEENWYMVRYVGFIFYLVSCGLCNIWDGCDLGGEWWGRVFLDWFIYI